MDAAEAAFAQLGFAGARIDAIAAASGYNKSLIYQYFGDKLALYTEVVKRADRVGEAAMSRAVIDALKDDSLAFDGQKFKAFLAATIEGLFQFLFEHPNYIKILFWEAADEWKTWNDITYRPDDVSELLQIARAAQKNGIIRPDFDTSMFPMLLMTVTASTIQMSYRFGDFWEAGDVAARRRQMSDQVCKFVLRGLIHPDFL